MKTKWLGVLLIFLAVLSVVLIFVLVGVGVNPRNGATPAQPKTIRIASDATWPPMEFINSDLEIIGFDIDLINAVADAAGFEVQIYNTAWDGIFAGLTNGDYDAVLSSVTITEERKRTMDFSLPYINAGQILILRQDAPTNIRVLADLAGSAVGAQIGTTGAIAIQETEGVELRTYDELGLAIEDLAQDRIAAVVADTPVAADYVLQNENYSPVLKIVGEPFTDEFYGIAVAKGNDEVLELINTGLEVVLNDGTVEALKDKWLR